MSLWATMRTTKTTNTTAGFPRTATSRSAPRRSGRVFLHTARYDANGRRVEKAVSGGITERYVYSALETVETYNGSNTWKQSFVFGQGIDNVLMLEQADVLDYDSDSNVTEITRSFYHRNALGSVMDITDMNPAKVESYRYAPYGAPTISRNSQVQSTDPLGQHWGYTGRFHDEECGLNYYRGRYYDPAVGRFLERDRLGYSQGPNLFSYASSSPIVRDDPTGLGDESPVPPPDEPPPVIPPGPPAEPDEPLPPPPEEPREPMPYPIPTPSPSTPVSCAGSSSCAKSFCKGETLTSVEVYTPWDDPSKHRPDPGDPPDAPKGKYFRGLVDVQSFEEWQSGNSMSLIDIQIDADLDCGPKCTCEIFNITILSVHWGSIGTPSKPADGSDGTIVSIPVKVRSHGICRPK